MKFIYNCKKDETEHNRRFKKYNGNEKLKIAFITVIF